MAVFDDLSPEERELQALGLTAMLEQIYQMPDVSQETSATITHAQQEYILARARARLLTADLSVSEHERTMPSLVELLVKTPKPGLDEPLPLKPPARAHRFSRVVQILNALAAILVVALLSAGALALFVTHHSSVGRGINTPLLDLSCVPRIDVKFPTGSGSFKTVPEFSGPGLESLCTQHLIQKLNLVQVDGEFRVTVTHGYADPGMIAFWYQIERKVNGKYQLLTPWAANMGGSQLEVLASTHMSSHEIVATGMGSADLEEFFPTTFDPSWTAFTIVMKRMNIELNSPDSGTLTESFPSFQFTLPIHGNWHSHSFQHTQVDHGYALTLKGAGYSLSRVDATVDLPVIQNTNLYKMPSISLVSFQVANVECLANEFDRQNDYPLALGPGPSHMALTAIHFQATCSLSALGLASGSLVTLTFVMRDSSSATTKDLARWTFQFPLP